MAATLKASWDQFDDAEYVEFAILKDGAPLGSPLQLPGTAVEQEFFAIDYPESTYAAHVRGVSPVIPCTITVVSEGGGGGSSGGGGGGE